MKLLTDWWLCLHYWPSCCFSRVIGDLKRICETDLGLVSQCCLTKHVFRRNTQYLANVALKINVKVLVIKGHFSTIFSFPILHWAWQGCLWSKVGGRNTVLVDALLRRIPLVTDTDTPTIIFGADVTHPPPGEDKSPSIAAVSRLTLLPHFFHYIITFYLFGVLLNWLPCCWK